MQNYLQQDPSAFLDSYLPTVAHDLESGLCDLEGEMFHCLGERLIEILVNLVPEHLIENFINEVKTVEEAVNKLSAIDFAKKGSWSLTGNEPEYQLEEVCRANIYKFLKTKHPEIYYCGIEEYALEGRLKGVIAEYELLDKIAQWLPFMMDFELIKAFYEINFEGVCSKHITKAKEKASIINKILEAERTYKEAYYAWANSLEIPKELQQRFEMVDYHEFIELFNKIPKENRHAYVERLNLSNTLEYKMLEMYPFPKKKSIPSQKV